LWCLGTRPARVRGVKGGEGWGCGLTYVSLSSLASGLPLERLSLPRGPLAGLLAGSVRQQDHGSGAWGVGEGLVALLTPTPPCSSCSAQRLPDRLRGDHGSYEEEGFTPGWQALFGVQPANAAELCVPSGRGARTCGEGERGPGVLGLEGGWVCSKSWAWVGGQGPSWRVASIQAFPHDHGGACCQHADARGGGAFGRRGGCVCNQRWQG
jgi:hypothetical protein